MSSNWLYWSRLSGLTNANVSAAHDGSEVRFTSDDYSVYLRQNDGWWVLDTVNDRGQLHTDTAAFTSLDLVEKYLLWQWSSSARNNLRLPRIGPKIYSLGHDPHVHFSKIKEGIYELQKGESKAILSEPAATIFSHLMSKTLDEIEQIVSEGLGAR
ncbi:Imm61 family immunity protein [Mycolicibacterium sp. GCM10028919]|uniref:Imm61 family immunity protein n=1 Tax=Mycolicibacterium sp. GCM10028919 TaxID=3273401 RepID=UPI00361EA3BD